VQNYTILADTLLRNFLNGKRRRKGHDKKPPRWRIFGVTFAPEAIRPAFFAHHSQRRAGAEERKPRTDPKI